MRRYENLLCQRICVGTEAELLEAACELIGKGGAIATVNPIMLTDAVRIPELADALYDSLNIPDGIGIAKAFKRRGVYTRVYPGIELCEAMLDSGDLTFAIIGGKEGVAEEAKRHLEANHRSAKCLFTQDGYSFDKEVVKAALRRLQPTLVLVCLGSPRQELLIHELRKSYAEGVYMGLGGALDVFSGRVKRAPELMRRMGLEWLWRMVTQPQRLKRLPKIFDFLTMERLERSLPMAKE